MGKSIWDKIKSIFLEPKEEESAIPAQPKPKLNFIHWMVIVVCLGLAAMILHNFFSINSELQTNVNQPALPEEEPVESTETLGAGSRASPSTMEEYEQLYEKQLTEILSTIAGVGEVRVMVNLDSTEEVVVEKNRSSQHSQTTENDREGGSRSIDEQVKDEQVVILRNDSGEEPVVLMTKKPPVRGVLVVASGANHTQVKIWITEAIQRVMDVPTHKISVLPKKQ